MIYFSSQTGQTSSAEVKKRDLRADLLAAEQEARNKKRKAEGKPPLEVEGPPADEEANKRRKLLQDALQLDKDDEDEDDDEKKSEAKDKDEEEDRCVSSYHSLLRTKIGNSLVMRILTTMKTIRLSCCES